MEGEYEKIREELQKPEEKLEKAVEPEKAAEPEKAEPEAKEGSAGGTTERPPRQSVPQKAVEPEKATDADAALQAEPQKPKKAKAAKKAEDGAPKEKPPRMTCEGCGRSYSIHTKRHVCKAPKGFEKKENVPPEPVPPPMPGAPEEHRASAVDLQRQITLADVTQFLFAESKARRDKRRDDPLAKMF